jgi:hypothetical protein
MFRRIPESKASLLPEFLITRASDFSRAIVQSLTSRYLSCGVAVCGSGDKKPQHDSQELLKSINGSDGTSVAVN